MQAICSLFDVVAVNGSMELSSCCEYCQSARSLKRMDVERISLSEFCTNVYVGSGGTKANFAAICDGNGGQQNMLQSRRNVENVAIVEDLLQDLQSYSTITQ